MEKEVNTYQQFNFQIALEKIEALTEQNNELLDKVDELEVRLEDAKLPDTIQPDTATTRYNNVSRKANAAMKRFTTKLKKEIDKNAKSKQSQRQPV